MLDLSKLAQAKRAWVFSDLHFGARNNNVEWVEIMERYFMDDFLPTLERERAPGDVAVCLGDVFDSRNAINIKVLDLALEIFGRLSKLMPVVVIAGNHDCYLKSTTSINSIRPLGLIDNVGVLVEPASVMLGPKRCLLMPWRKDHAAEKECIAAYPGHEWLLCHFDVNGASLGRRAVMEHGCSPADCSAFGRVYTGHIHLSQTIDNVRIVGCPYELTRSDYGNRKAIVLVDLATGEETLFENRTSPRGVTIRLERLMSMTLGELTSQVRGNFVDIHGQQEMLSKLPLRDLMEHMSGARSVEVWPDVAKVVHVKDGEEESTELVVEMADNDVRLGGWEFSVESMIKEYSETRTELTEDEKQRLEGSLIIAMRRAEEEMGTK